MRRSVVVLMVAVLVSVSLVGCGDSCQPDESLDPFVEREIPGNLESSVAGVAESNLLFAVDLYRDLRETDDGNLFLSPFSISTALAMTTAGARGNTETEMRTVLHFPTDDINLHTSYGALVTSLNRGTELGGYRLNVANRLWGQTGHTFLDDYLTICRDDYQAPLEQLDFIMEAEAARLTINTWVEDQTEEKIKDLLAQGTVTDMTRLVLTNAIYFKGDWLIQFDATATEPLPFHLSGSDEVTVSTMFQEEDFPFAKSGNLSILQLPYVGEDLSMILLLPDETDGIGELEESLTSDNLTMWLGALSEQTVLVYLPKFEFTSSFCMVDLLTGLGMIDAFIPGTADFSGMTGSHELFLSDVVHKAYVKVNEEGTEAAAATAAVAGTTSMPTVAVFRADHPFLFLIWDHVTESLLFMGRVMDPS